LAFGIIALSPVSRGVSYFVAPAFRGSEGIMLHTRLDTIMFGCLIALLWEDAAFNRFLDRVLRPGLVAFLRFSSLSFRRSRRLIFGLSTLGPSDTRFGAYVFRPYSSTRSDVRLRAWAGSWTGVQYGTLEWFPIASISGSNCSPGHSPFGFRWTCCFSLRVQRAHIFS